MEPTSPPAPPGWPRNVIRTSTVLAWLAVAAAAAGVVLFLVPVSHSYRGHLIQDCGVPAAYLKDGRSSVLVDPQDPPTWIPKARVAATNASQCSQQVADRAVPAGSSILGSFVLGLVALTMAWIGHRAEDRSAWTAAPV